jgi:hypothetical protein
VQKKNPVRRGDTRRVTLFPNSLSKKAYDGMLLPHLKVTSPLEKLLTGG